MDSQIYLISGFFESGKTTFINRVLQTEEFKDGKQTLLICCEEGIVQYDRRILKGSNTTLVTISDEKELNTTLFRNILKKYSPHRIIIEYNGTWEIGGFLRLRLPEHWRVGKIITLADMNTFRLYMSNMSTIMTEQFSNSDEIVLINGNSLVETEIKSIKRTLKGINRHADIRELKSNREEDEITEILEISPAGIGNITKKFLWLIIALIASFLLYISSQAKVNGELLTKIQSLNTVFISILLQALPFILMGVFVSSFLQVYISDERIIGLFTRYRGIGFVIAILLGICFPVCDCAMAPITARMARKGVPVCFVTAFLLAAPVVNPVVILSTFYAFPENLKIVFLRITFGISIALLTGLFVKLAGVTAQSAIREKIYNNSTCSVDYAGRMLDYGFKSKLRTLVLHSGIEFFKLSKYVILGAFITSLFQVLAERNSLLGISVKPMLILLVMTLTSMLMSVCSTSNAFMAKSFSYSFPLYSVIYYMVMGPMLDIKNILMLSGSYKIKFLTGLVFVILTVGIFVFSCGALLV